METRTYKKALSELGFISNKIEIYVNNNVAVPEKLCNDFALTVLDVLDKFIADMGQERLDMISSSIDKYYEGLEEKVSGDIGPLSPIMRKLLIQGYTAIRNKLEIYASSNYLDEQFIKNIMNIENLLDRACAVEYKKTDKYLRKDFDYASYFYNLRNSSVDTAKEAYMVAIHDLLASTSDTDFYHYLELCSLSGTAFDAIVLLGEW